MRIASLNMTQPDEKCPDPLLLIKHWQWTGKDYVKGREADAPAQSTSQHMELSTLECAAGSEDSREAALTPLEHQ